MVHRLNLSAGGGSWSAMVCVVTAVTVAVTATGRADAQKRRPASRPAARTTSKPDPVNLVGAIAFNRLREGETLFAACDRSSFKTLAIASTMRCPGEHSHS